MKLGAAVITAILLALGPGASVEQVPSNPPVAQPTPRTPQSELPAGRTVADQHKAVRKQAPKRQGDQGPASVPAVPVPKVETQPLAPPGKQADDDEKNGPTPSVLDFFTPSGWKEISAYCASRPEGGPDNWLHEKFICDVHVTDVAIATFAFLLVIVFGGLILVGASQNRRARRSISLARESLVSTQRAFIFVARFDCRAIGVKDSEEIVLWRIGPQWENSGPTPTKHALNHISYGLFSGNGPETVKFEDRWSAGARCDPSHLFIAPMGVTLGEKVEIPVRDFVSGKTAFIWGWIDYNDIFPNTSRHRTEFCAEIVLRGDPKVHDPAPFEFRFYGLHNGAEDECHHRPAPYAPPQRP